MSVVRRVHVIGGGGSGKTTLARRLGSRTGLPVFELDTGADLDPSAESWISDGIFLYDIGQVLDRADVIVWLDLPPRTALRRIVLRHIKLSIRRQNAHPGIRRLLRFARTQRTYYTAPPRDPTGPTDWSAITRAQTVVVLEPRRDKVVHLRTPREVRMWLRSGQPSAR